jgi:type II secretory pathway component PulJ
MNRRHGVSLVELAVVMSACAVLLTLSAAFLQRVMQAQVRSRAAAELHLTLLRLDQNFRQDVHGSDTAAVDPTQLMSGIVLRLESSGVDAIEYRHHENSLERVQFVAGEIQSRETFTFPREIDPKISSPQPKLIALSITADDEQIVAAPPVHVRIEAALHRDGKPGREDARE